MSKNKTMFWCEISVFGLKGRFLQPRPNGLVVLYKWLNARIAIAVSAYQTKRYVEIIYRRSTLATLYPTTGYDLYSRARATPWVAWACPGHWP